MPTGRISCWCEFPMDMPVQWKIAYDIEFCCDGLTFNRETHQEDKVRAFLKERMFAFKCTQASLSDRVTQCLYLLKCFSLERICEEKSQENNSNTKFDIE